MGQDLHQEKVYTKLNSTSMTILFMYLGQHLLLKASRVNFSFPVEGSTQQSLRRDELCNTETKVQPETNLWAQAHYMHNNCLCNIDDHTTYQRR